MLALFLRMCGIYIFQILLSVIEKLPITCWYGDRAFRSIITMSAYILIVHLLFKELHTLFGKLLIFYNLCVVSTSTDVMALLVMHYWITVNSQMICHTATVMFTLTYAGAQIFATCILTHLAYLMYRCYHLMSEMSKKNQVFYSDVTQPMPALHS